MSSDRRTKPRQLRPLAPDELLELKRQALPFSTSLAERRWRSESEIDLPSLPPISGTTKKLPSININLKVHRPPTPSPNRSPDYVSTSWRKERRSLSPPSNSTPRRTRSLDMRPILEGSNFRGRYLYCSSSEEDHRLTEAPESPRLCVRSLPSSPNIPRRNVRIQSFHRRLHSADSDADRSEGSKEERIMTWIQDVAGHNSELEAEEDVFSDSSTERESGNRSPGLSVIREGSQT